MAQKRILIVGDSFCAPGPAGHAWYNLLADKYHIDNRAKNGVGQYKVHRQIEACKGDWDAIIYGITSPFRIHTERNPFYDQNHASHSAADLIYEDVRSRLPDAVGDHIVWWFENVFDLEQALFVHGLIVEHDCRRDRIVPITFFDSSHISNLAITTFQKIWHANPGTINHLSANGHRLIFEKIDKILQTIT
jgi:hypothetical protein